MQQAGNIEERLRSRDFILGSCNPRTLCGVGSVALLLRVSPEVGIPVINPPNLDSNGPHMFLPTISHPGPEGDVSEDVHYSVICGEGNSEAIWKFISAAHGGCTSWRTSNRKNKQLGWTFNNTGELTKSTGWKK